MPDDRPPTPEPGRARRSGRKPAGRSGAPVPDERARRRPRRPPLRTDAPKRVDGGLVGPYETSYDIAHGYTTERAIVRP